MSRSYLITGGAASGKSRWAITYFEDCDNVLYISTDAQIDPDALSRMKVNAEEHKVNWVTKVLKTRPAEAISEEKKFYIFDNVASYCNRIIRDMAPDIADIPHGQQKEIAKRIVEDILKMLDTVNELDGNIILITLETGFSVVPSDLTQNAFREILGAVNQRLANICDEVYLCVSGLQMKMK